MTPTPFAITRRIALLAAAASLGCGGDLTLPGDGSRTDTLRALSTLAQPGQFGQPLPDPLVVLVVDQFGNPVPGVEIEWKVEEGKGEVSQSETATGADGTASVTWTLGRRLGVQSVTARVKESDVFGSPVTFTATVLF